MFAYPEPAVGYPRGPLKRYHEDELVELAGGAPMGFNEHRNKRLHTSTLPLRTSPSSRKWPGQSSEIAPMQSTAITPPSSYPDAHPGAGVVLHQQSPPQPMMGFVDMDTDMAMDGLDGFQPAVQPASQQSYTAGQLLAPGPLQPDHMDMAAAGRIPTPLQPSFAAQVRGGNWGNTAANSSQSGLSPRLSHPVLEATNGMGDWDMVQNRSLPSPISEIGGEDGGMSDMAYNMAAVRGDSAMPISTPTRPSAAMAVSPMAALSSPVHVCGSPDAADGDPAVSPTPRKGHTRSRHTVVAWTPQPGMKKSFSIGYRADCEKCRNRVPGHFNHIIVS